jgi:hypothetical protein
MFKSNLLQAKRKFSLNFKVCIPLRIVPKSRDQPLPAAASRYAERLLAYALCCVPATCWQRALGELRFGLDQVYFVDSNIGGRYVERLVRARFASQALSKRHEFDSSALISLTQCSATLIAASSPSNLSADYMKDRRHHEMDARHS